jgi:uncharacterized protein DUF5985
MRAAAAFLFGMLVMGCGIASVFFAKFWSTTRERLFLYLALAFALLGAERVAALVALVTPFETVWLYVLRLAAFLVIIVGLVEKNR